MLNQDKEKKLCKTFIIKIKDMITAQKYIMLI